MIRKIGDTSASYRYTSRYVLKAGQTVTVSGQVSLEMDFRPTSVGQKDKRIFSFVLPLYVFRKLSPMFVLGICCVNYWEN